MTDAASATQVPIVGYLQLGDEPHLLANECAGCGARYFDRRNACANCGGIDFGEARVADTAVLKAYSIVHNAAPGIPEPYVSANVETTDGTSVRSNVVGLADPMDAELGMSVALTTYVCGTDDDGTECVAFGYAPA